jgi:hypothetical protein
MEFSSFQRLLEIIPTQDEKLAVARLIDNGAQPVNGTPYIAAPFVLVDRVREHFPEIRRRLDVEILYDPRSHAVWLGYVKKPGPPTGITPLARAENVSLSKFLSDNDKLVTVIGILLGVAVFSSPSPAKPIGQIVVFCIFACALLAWGELLYIYNRTAYPAAGQLQVFMLFFLLAFIASVFYWLIEFSAFRTFAMAAILLQIARHIVFAKRLEAAKTQLRRTLLLLALGAITLGLGALLNLGLDRINRHLISRQPTPQQQP